MFINEFNKYVFKNVAVRLLDTFVLVYRNTFVLRQTGESPNDRNDRAIRKIAQFYSEHLKNQSNIKRLFKMTDAKLSTCLSLVSIVLLTDDIANRDHARSDGLLAFSCKLYFNISIELNFYLL